MDFESIAKLLAKYKDIEWEKLTPETTFEELELDSLDIVELLMRIEDEFEVALELEESMTTIGGLVDAVKKQREQDNA